MNKVVYVEAHFKPVGKVKTISVPTGEKKKGFFGGEKVVTRKEEQWEQTGWSDSEVDGERLAQDIERAVNELNESGYEVVSLTPITSGDYNWAFRTADSPKKSWGYGYGYGFSYTEGMTIIARKTV